MTLRRLNDEVKARLRSSAMIVNVCGCARELIYNSLDAGAAHITVKLDIGKYFLQVLDDGSGISHEDMIVLGGQSFTSKWHALKDVISGTMGYKGEALFSICDLSGTVEVCSRHQLSSETWCKLFHHGRDVGVTHSSIHRKSAGTSVTLHDMFFNMPVRQKCIKESVEVEHIRQIVQQIALVNSRVSFSVENNTTGVSILKSRKAQSTLEKISHFYGPVVSKSMKPIEHSSNKCCVSGYVSTEFSSSKSLRLVYVNRQLVCQNQIHTLLDNILIQRTHSKTTDQHYPQYLITIQCSPLICDLYYQPSKTLVEFDDWPAVLKLIAAAAENTISSIVKCPDILTEDVISHDNDECIDICVGSRKETSIHFSHGVQSEMVRKVKTTSLSPPKETADVTSYPNKAIMCRNTSQLNNFIGVNTISHSPLHTSSIAQTLAKFCNGKGTTPMLQKITSNCKLPKQHSNCDMLVSPFMPLDHSTPLQDPLLNTSSHTNTSGNMNTQSDTNNNKLIASQCHTSTAYGAELSCSSLFVAPHDITSIVSKGNRVHLSSTSSLAVAGDKLTSSVKMLLSHWHNPVFKTGQEHITGTSQCHPVPIPMHNMVHTYRFTKLMFHNIRVIEQVDKKFIACMMDTRCSGNHDLLVLVDQHAAHERVRLEQLTSELYSGEKQDYSNSVTGHQIQSSTVEPPVKLHREVCTLPALRTFHKQLHEVGIGLDEARGSVVLHKLPSVLVSNRLPIVSTATIEEMIKEHIEHLSSTGGASRTIPHILTEILATQACHGAIKFNDPLTWNECNKLMESLSHCKLPFQCAHGRPSLVPLLDISLPNSKRNIVHNTTILSNK